MTNRHPNYPNPPVVEVLCEIHFTPANATDWAPTRPFALYQALEADFSLMEVVPEISVRVEITPEGPRPTVQQESNRVRFSAEDRTRLVQVSANTFVMNWLRPYPGWDAARSKLVSTWSKAASIFRPETINRVHLRYVNRIEHSEDAPNLSDWLQATAVIPTALINSAAGYAASMSIAFDEEQQLRMTIRHADRTPSLPHGVTLFDLERRITRRQPLNTEGLIDVIDGLHEDIWSEFSAASTEKLRKKMNEKK